jgi:uncharacterized protein YjbJ (UPF0337 family)
MVGNKEMEIKGSIQNTKGKVQAAVGDAKERLKHASHCK